MKPHSQVWRRIFGADLKLTFRVWLPVFLLLVWLGVLLRVEDFGLWVLAMALAAWAVCSHAVLVLRKWQEWRKVRREKEKATG